MIETVDNKHNSNNRLIYFIIGGWAIVVSSILVFYLFYEGGEKNLWAFENYKLKSVVILHDNNHLDAKELEQLYTSLSNFQNLEKSTLLHTTNINSKDIYGKNLLFCDTWDNLGMLEFMLPDSIVSFDNESRILRWKHEKGYYDLPLNNDKQSLTYVLAGKLQTQDHGQSIFIIHLDEIKQYLFLNHVLDPKNIEQLKGKLNMEDDHTSFIALYKMPKRDAISGKIELLDGHIIQP